jgi:transposase
MNNELYIGLDVHSEAVVVAVAEGGRSGEVRDHGSISNDVRILEKLVARLRKTHGADVKLRFCYEAGPCGFGIARKFKQMGIECMVVAPSKIPVRSGDRVKTDRRDAAKLARLLRAGELTAVYVPDPTDEAIRDMCRARTDAVDDARRNRCRLKAFLLRHGYHYRVNTHWGDAHLRFLRGLALAHPAMKAILEEYLCAIEFAAERITRCEASMAALLEGWPLKPAVEAVMTMRGFEMVAAMIVVSELGDIHRFDHPRQLMGYLGLVSRERTSSTRRRQGAITKTGNPHLRWLLIESAQHYALAPKVSRALSKRQEGQCREVLQLSWKAQNRLHHRFTRLVARRLQRNKALVAVARELCGFLWAVLQTQTCYVQQSRELKSAA